MPAKAGKIKLCGSSEIAAFIGVDTRRVQQLAKEGVFEPQRVGNANKYELLSTVQKYIEYLQECVNRRASEANADLEKEKLKAEVGYKRARAGKAALELKELEGIMHRSEDVEAMTTDLVMTVRGLFMSLSGRMATELASLNTPEEVAARLKNETDSMLRTLENYRYDPAAYRQRVMDRQGWGGGDDAEEED